MSVIDISINFIKKLFDLRFTNHDLSLINKLRGKLRGKLRAIFASNKKVYICQKI